MTYEQVMALARKAGFNVNVSDDPNSPPSWWGCAHNPAFERFAQLVTDAMRPEERQHEWTWSLEQPEVSGWRWIETWDASALELNVLRFHVGDSIAPNVACWRYVDPPTSSPLRNREHSNG